MNKVLVLLGIVTAAGVAIAISPGVVDRLGMGDPPDTTHASIPNEVAASQSMAQPEDSAPTTHDREPVASEPRLLVHGYQSVDQIVDYLLSIGASKEVAEKLRASYVIWEGGITGACPGCDDVVDLPAHPYFTYEVSALRSLAYGDAAAARVLSERLWDNDRDASLEYALRATALSGKPGPLWKIQELAFHTRDGSIQREALMANVQELEDHLFEDASISSPIVRGWVETIEKIKTEAGA